MERYITLFYFILLILITSCQHKKTKITPILVQAEQLIENDPDSALKLLSKESSIVYQENKSKRMYYFLLKTEAEDKCHIAHLSDSTMQYIANYYEYHDNDILKIKSYYLLGRIYGDMGITNEAIIYFKKLLTINIKDNTEIFIMRARANNQIGQILMRQDMYKEALPFFYATYHHAKLAKDNLLIVYALRNIGRSYFSQGEKEKGVNFFNYASKIAQNTNQKYLYKIIMSELAELYCTNKQFNKAKAAFSSAKDLLEKDKTQYYISLAKYFQYTNRLDSSIVYLKKTINSNHLYTARKASLILNEIYKRNGNNKLAYYYLSLYSSYSDSLSNEKIKENNNLITLISKKLEIEEKYFNLKRHTNEQILVSLIIAFSTFILILSIYYYYRNKKIQYTLQRERLEYLFSITQQDNKKRTELNNKRIAELEVLLSFLQTKYDESQKELLLAEKNNLKKNNTQMTSESTLRKLRIQKFKCSEIYELFHQINFNPTTKDYIKLEQTLDEIYNNCFFHLRKVTNITEKEICVCLLIKADIPLKIISILTKSEMNSLSMLRSRLFQKIFHKKGSSTDLDNFIRDL